VSVVRIDYRRRRAGTLAATYGRLNAVAGTIGRRIALAAGLATITLAGASCGGDDSTTAGGTLPLFGGTVPEGGPAIDLTPSQGSGGDERNVVMVGDSITVRAAPLIEAATTPLDLDVDIHAEVGRRITSGRDPAAGTDVLAEVLADTKPDLVVVALGTNDVGKYTSIQDYAGQIEALLDLVPDDTPVVWINTYLAARPDESATFNAALLDTLASRGNTTIGRWSSIAQRDGVLSDGVHPSEVGTQEFADLVVGEIENWLD
jgi:lysophospholipase L1-like esterase